MILSDKRAFVHFPDIRFPIPDSRFPIFERTTMPLIPGNAETVGVDYSLIVRVVLTFPVIKTGLVGPDVLLSVLVCSGTLPVGLARGPLALVVAPHTWIHSHAPRGTRSRDILALYSTRIVYVQAEDASVSHKEERATAVTVNLERCPRIASGSTRPLRRRQPLGTCDLRHGGRY